MASERQRILFWGIFALFAASVIWTGYYHLFGAGYFRPILVAESKLLSLGNVPSDKPAEREFLITNKGLRSLRVLKVRPGCSGCIEIIAYPKEPIRSGESASIKIALQTEGLSGTVRKTIMIISNDPRHPSTPIMIDAVIEPQEPERSDYCISHNRLYDF